MLSLAPSHISSLVILEEIHKLSNFTRTHQEFCDITCGVPQGSVLGPISFLLFINDIFNFVAEGCVLHMYADDVIIYPSATSKDGLEYRL